MTRFVPLLVLALAGSTAGSTALSATLTDDVDVDCVLSESLVLECEYRILTGGELTSAAAESAGVVVDGDLTSGVGDTEGDAAILFLVDTSDPGRSAVVEKNREHIRRILDAAGGHRIFGIASFDSDLHIVCDLPCAADNLSESLEALVANGKTTELYRNVLGAIKYLSQTNSRKNLIVLMSDGLAEDLAYGHEDVIAAARKDKVVISSLGYPRSVAQSVALQTLRRLSEESGGLFAQADPAGFQIPAGFFDEVMTAIDGGGRSTFELSEIQNQGVTGPIDVSLKLQTRDRDFGVGVPIEIPTSVKEPEPQPVPEPVTVTETLAANPAPLPPPAPATQEPTRVWFWYVLPATVFAAILAIAISYAAFARRRREDARIPLGEQTTPHAFLVSTGRKEVRYKIDHTPWRIGRSRNSELPLDDTSVSRLHAEIRRDALGQFTLQDLNSLNGVFVNGQSIDIAHLDEGDRIEVGDVGFVFTLHDEDYAKQEPTVLVRTLTPT